MVGGWSGEIHWLLSAKEGSGKNLGEGQVLGATLGKSQEIDDGYFGGSNGREAKSLPELLYVRGC